MKDNNKNTLRDEFWTRQYKESHKEGSNMLTFFLFALLKLLLILFIAEKRILSDTPLLHAHTNREKERDREKSQH